MTCILAMIDRVEGRVYVGGDRAASHTGGQFSAGLPKVFYNGEFLFGCSGSFRQAQILEYVFAPPALDPALTQPTAYMVKEFIPALRAAMKEAGVSQSDNGADTSDQSSGFIVAWRDHLWTVYWDYAVMTSTNGVAAVGSGLQYGLGALTAMLWPGGAYQQPEPRNPARMIERALEISAQYSPGVDWPFDVLHTTSANLTYTAPPAVFCMK